MESREFIENKIDVKLNFFYKHRKDGKKVEKKLSIIFHLNFLFINNFFAIMLMLHFLEKFTQYSLCITSRKVGVQPVMCQMLREIDSHGFFSSSFHSVLFYEQIKKKKKKKKEPSAEKLHLQ